MEFDQLIKHFGTQAKLAKAVRRSQPTISNWQKRGIPYGAQLEIQFLTAGLFQAEPPKRRKTESA